MFETDEDFDIDEDFLKGVFETGSDALHTTNQTKGEKRSSLGEDSSDESKKQKQADNESDCPNLSSNIPVLSRKLDSENVNLNVSVNNGCFVLNNVSSQLNPTTKKTNRCESLSNKSTQDLFAESQGSRHSVKLSAVNSATPQRCAKTVSRQRKFPGPAGLFPLKDGSPLPNPSSDDNLLDDEDESPLPNTSSDDNLPNNKNPSCSQSTVRMFEGAAWQQMLKEFELTDDSLPISQFNIAWIKSRAKARQLFDQKIPFLAVLLRHLDCSSLDPCIVLLDKTGDMHGMLHREVWEQYGGQLNVGSVLVLRDVGVLSTSLHTKRHFLTITCNNVLSLYNNIMHNDNPTGKVRTTRIQQITQQELLKTITDWQSQQSSVSLESRVPRSPNCLFSTFSSPVGQGRGTVYPNVNHRHQLNASGSSSPVSTAAYRNPTGRTIALLNKPGSSSPSVSNNSSFVFNPGSNVIGRPSVSNNSSTGNSNVIDRPSETNNRSSAFNPGSNVIVRSSGTNNRSFVFNPQSTSVSNTPHNLPCSSSISTPKYKGGFTPKVSSFASLSSTPKVNETGNPEASTISPVMKKNNNVNCSGATNYNNIFTLNKTGNDESDLDVLEGLDCSSFFDEF